MYNDSRAPEPGFVPTSKMFVLVNIHRALASGSCFFKFCARYSRKNSSFFFSNFRIKSFQIWIQTIILEIATCAFDVLVNIADAFAEYNEKNFFL